MAIISLEPNESFEHYHSAPSRTIHLDGEIEFEATGIHRRLRRGEIIDVAGNTLHVITNVGTGLARVNCVGTGGGSHAPARIDNNKTKK